MCSTSEQLLTMCLFYQPAITPASGGVKLLRFKQQSCGSCQISHAMLSLGLLPDLHIFCHRSDLKMAGTVNGQPLHGGSAGGGGSYGNDACEGAEASSSDSDVDVTADSEAQMAGGLTRHRKRDRLLHPRHRHLPPRIHLQVCASVGSRV